jgi:hypothetical protein
LPEHCHDDDGPVNSEAKDQARCSPVRSNSCRLL